MLKYDIRLIKKLKCKVIEKALYSCCFLKKRYGICIMYVREML